MSAEAFSPDQQQAINQKESQAQISTIKSILKDFDSHYEQYFGQDAPTDNPHLDRLVDTLEHAGPTAINIALDQVKAHINYQANHPNQPLPLSHPEIYLDFVAELYKPSYKDSVDLEYKLSTILTSPLLKDLDNTSARHAVLTILSNHGTSASIWRVWQLGQDLIENEASYKDELPKPELIPEIEQVLTTLKDIGQNPDNSSMSEQAQQDLEYYYQDLKQSLSEIRLELPNPSDSSNPRDTHTNPTTPSPTESNPSTTPQSSYPTLDSFVYESPGQYPMLKKLIDRLIDPDILPPEKNNADKILQQAGVMGLKAIADSLSDYFHKPTQDKDTTQVRQLLQLLDMAILDLAMEKSQHIDIEPNLLSYLHEPDIIHSFSRSARKDLFSLIQHYGTHQSAPALAEIATQLVAYNPYKESVGPPLFKKFLTMDLNEIDKALTQISERQVVLSNDPAINIQISSAQHTIYQLKQDLEYGGGMLFSSSNLPQSQLPAPTTPEHFLPNPDEQPIPPIRVANLDKIAEQQGSNEGGWYKDRQTGQEYYIKIPANTDQARVEYIANSVYAKLNIPAAKSQLVEMDGRLAIASPKIDGAHSISYADLINKNAIGYGFVADAYLANWDVVGLNYDNILFNTRQSPSPYGGTSYSDVFTRVDNGGSLLFRAQGGHKDFSPHAIPELDSLRDPSLAPQAHIAFKDLTDKDLELQARYLVKNLTEQDIHAIIDQSNIEGESKDQILQGLLGRRQVLMDKYNIIDESRPQRARPTDREVALQYLRRLEEENGETNVQRQIWPKTEYICDHNHIEGQRINTIHAKELGKMYVNFKVTADYYQKLLNSADFWDKQEYHEFSYQDAHGNAVLNIGTGLHYKLDNATVRIAAVKNTASYRISDTQQELPVIDQAKNQSARGLVSIEFTPRHSTEIATIDPDLVDQLNRAFSEVLRIDNALEPPSPQAEKSFFANQYKWHHKLDNTFGLPVDQEHLQRLVRKEVAPNYSTVVENGRHLEYHQKHGAYAMTHEVQYPDQNLLKIIQGGGLLCTHERYSRGIPIQGMSSIEDFNRGGADSVFVRTTTAKGINHSRDKNNNLNCQLVFKPSLANRTDWYAYETDCFGSTESHCFNNRLNPDQLFDSLNNQRLSSNEQMFRTAIGLEDVAGIACAAREHIRDSAIDNLLSLRNDQDRLSYIHMKNLWEDNPLLILKLLKEADPHHDLDQYNYDMRLNSLKTLQKAGILHINNTPIHRFIRYCATQRDIIDMANGLPIGTLESMAAQGQEQEYNKQSLANLMTQSS